VSDGWFRRFMNRQKTITLQKGDPTAQVWMEACSPAIITRYFDQLKSKKRTSRAQKRSNTTKEPNAPKRVRLDRVEVSGSDSTLKPYESKRGQQSEVYTGDHSGGDAIDVNMCYICFGMYEDDVQEGRGTEWRECVCGRWVHKDCIVDVVVESCGKERLCPVCVI